jgi:signal transduction histidine kinase
MEGLVVILQNLSPEAEAQQTRLETIASMAEELRTPMSTVIGYTDLLLSEAMGGVAGVQRKFLLRIKADAERMIQVLNDLAREAGSEDQWSHPQRQTMHLNDEVEDAVASARSQFDIKALSTETVLASDLPTIKADPAYLQRILAGLLSNACMASPVGGKVLVQSFHSDRPASDSPSVRDTPDFVSVSISDQGGGLTDTALDQVFERTRPSQTPPGLGESGAGLALVRALVEAHGGHLWVDSRVGASTTFSFALPVDIPDDQDRIGSLDNGQDQPASADVSAG